MGVIISKMNTYTALQKAIPLIETRLGYLFKNKSLLILAFIHRSFTNENQEITIHNERLEFLGDAVLGLIVSDCLYSHFPNYPEGDLSYLRSRLVNGYACSRYLQKIDLERFLLIGKGGAMNMTEKGRETIRADLFEAIIGAIYFDGGIEGVRSFFFGHFKKEVLQIVEKPLRNWKAELQDFCQKKYRILPKYRVVEDKGPDHLKTFFVEVHLEGKFLGKGKGMSKKEAEQQAAEDAIYNLGIDR